MGSNRHQAGRHRLGMANGVHCTLIPAVATALEEHRRNWFTALVSPARHSFAAMRKRTATASTHWVPATAS
ncbi:MULTISPECIES: hypothetical protein [Antrihabitans]|uniref:Uncharacterized protein n=2 Tax=Antrihabitans TaxID=2799491 RepID=A0A934NUC9_9NOCA|nr:hypothetical protein [Antrihabitans stalagmiti]MBJ8341586.1 hypothetical protein [Antrihabitans stalagmiti]